MLTISASHYPGNVSSWYFSVTKDRLDQQLVVQLEKVVCTYSTNTYIIDHRNNGPSGLRKRAPNASFYLYD